MKKSIQTLSDLELHRQTILSVKDEKEKTALVVEHLAEVTRRKLYLKRACSSPYRYAVELLNYTPASAFRRAAAARLALEVPSTLEGLRSGALSLCAAVEAYRRFESEKKKEKDIQTLEPQAELLPQPSPSKPAQTKLTKNDKEEIVKDLFGKSKNEAHAHLDEKLGGSKQEERAKTKHLAEERMKLEITLSKEDANKLKRLMSVLSHSIPDGDPAKLISRLLEEGMEKHCPKRRQERIDKRKEKRQEKRALHGEVKMSGEVQASSEEGPSGEAKLSRKVPLHREAQVNSEAQVHTANHPRFISALKERTVWERSEGGCQFRDSVTGKVCGATHRLDVDHVRPVREGGGNELENLRLLCHAHNRNWRVLGEGEK